MSDIRFMDMLFKRYANPMILLDQMIQSERLTEFVREFIQIRNEELIDQTRWDYWLHRVFDMSFGDFIERSTATGSEEINDAKLARTVDESLRIANNFCPS